MTVHTSNGSWRAQRLLLSAGAWTGSVLPELDLPLFVERQVQCWFEPASHPENFQPERCPIFLWEYAPSRFFYGFPDLGDGVKAAIHHEGQETDPETICREVQDADTEPLRAVLNRCLPNAAGRLRSAAVCMYTSTPDGHFILGHHPKWPQVIIASPCSGHGFKFSPVIGEISAMLLQDRVPPFDLSLFAPERFSRQGSTP